MSTDQASPPACNVVIALLTYKRAELVSNLLDNLLAMNVPEFATTSILIVENDVDMSAKPVVDTYLTLFSNLHYVVEARRGIPVARNRAIDVAFHLDADILCFIDDDEYPDKDWLANILNCWKSGKWDLVGGPVFVAPAPPHLTTWQRLIHSGLTKRASRKMGMTARAASSGRRYTIVTNNWLCGIDWLKRSKLRFDERLLYSGGSDTEFFRQAKASGCRFTWCPTAIVYEMILPDRLTLRYQFDRAANQSMNHFAMKHKKKGPIVSIAAMMAAAMRATSGVIVLIFPVFGIASPVIGVRSLGWSLGRVQALLGRHSKLYE